VLESLENEELFVFSGCCLDKYVCFVGEGFGDDQVMEDSGSSEVGD
jgi:hypothetical protein